MFDQQHPSTVGSLFSRVPNTVGWPAIDAMFGDQFFTLDGSPFQRGVPFAPEQRQERLPVLLDNRRQLCSDLIPETSWGSSLCNILINSSWNSLRAPMIRHNHKVCEVCGAFCPSLDLHEIWEYFIPKDWKNKLASLSENNMIFGAQKLVALWPVCHDCHECFHLGFAHTRDRLEAALQRVAAINIWSEDTVSLYYNALVDRFDFHNQFLWALDLSLIANLFPDGMVVRRSWQPAPDNPYVLVADGRFGKQVTILCNVSWRFHTDQAREPLPLNAVFD